MKRVFLFCFSLVFFSAFAVAKDDGAETSSSESVKIFGEMNPSEVLTVEDCLTDDPAIGDLIAGDMISIKHLKFCAKQFAMGMTSIFKAHGNLSKKDSTPDLLIKSRYTKWEKRPVLVGVFVTRTDWNFLIEVVGVNTKTNKLAFRFFVKSNTAASKNESFAIGSEAGDKILNILDGKQIESKKKNSDWPE